jgi:hypothetical protein
MAWQWLVIEGGEEISKWRQHTKKTAYQMAKESENRENMFAANQRGVISGWQNERMKIGSAINGAISACGSQLAYLAKTGYQQWQWRNGGHLGCESR